MMPFRSPKRRQSSFRPTLLAATVLVACWPHPPAFAQMEWELRGLPTEEELAGIGERYRRDREAAGDAQREPYRPSSPGALAEDTPAGGTSSDDAGLDFTDTPAPSRYTPSTARARARQAQAQAVATEPEVEEEPAQGLAVVREPSAGSLDREALGAIERENPRAAAIEGRGIAPEANPYAPLGMRAGRFIVNGTLEQGVTATSNADYSAAGTSAVLSETTLRLNAASDWSRHSASLSAWGIHRETISGFDLSETRAGIDARLDLDLADGWGAFAAAGYERGPESATSPIDFTGIVGQPIRQRLKAEFGVEREAGKVLVGLAGKVERDLYDDADLAGGGTLSQRDRDATLATATMRLGYQVSPALTPFVEFEGGRRSYDLALDSASYARSADRYAARAGLAFDLSEKFSGEVSAGYVREDFDDPRLAAIEGPSLAAEVDWSPVRGTVLRLSGDTRVEGTTTAADSGSILYTGALAVERELRANLTGTAALGAGWRDYVGAGGNDRFLTAEAGLTWWFNRHAGLSGRLRQEVFRSTLPNRSYDITSVFLGLRFQR
jgi:hypothetical protein